MSMRWLCRYGACGPPTSGPSSQSRPSQRSVSRSVACGVGVLDAEDEVAAVVAGERVVEQRSADEPDVRVAGRRRAEADAHSGARGLGGHALTTGLVSVPTPSIATVTLSPLTIGPTPAGVPVRMTSPGSSVIACEMCVTSCATL